VDVRTDGEVERGVPERPGSPPSPEEDRVDVCAREHCFDIPLLASRVAASADPCMREHLIGLFGANTGAAAALVALAERPDTVAAVASRGGRQDLAGDALPRVERHRDEGRVRHVWQLAICHDEEGLVRLDGATRSDPAQVAELARTAAAAWLVGAVPGSVDVVVAPPDRDLPSGGNSVPEAWDSIRLGRWADIHDLDHLEGAILRPGSLHGAGLDQLDEAVSAPKAIVQRGVGSRPTSAPDRSHHLAAKTTPAGLAATFTHS
jgi:hypothetical protein